MVSFKGIRIMTKANIFSSVYLGAILTTGIHAIIDLLLTLMLKTSE